MKLIGGATYMIKIAQSTRHLQHQTNTHFQWCKVDTLKSLKLHFKMLQNISLIVCRKKATKCVMFFPSQNDLNGALDVCV